jgi:hypothetical protein
MGVAKKKSRLNWTIQITFGIAITVIGLWMGMTMFLTLDLQVDLIGEPQAALTISPWPYPWGKVDFFSIGEGQPVQLIGTDSNGFDGWQINLPSSTLNTDSIRVVLYDLLGTTHVTELVIR